MYSVLALSLVFSVGLISYSNFLQQFEAYGGGGDGVTDVELPIISQMANEIGHDIFNDGPGSDGVIGHLLSGDNPYNDFQITGVNLGLLPTQPMNGTISAVIYEDVVEFGDLADATLIATSDSYDLAILTGTDFFDRQLAVFNFSTPVTVSDSETLFVGMKFVGLNATLEVDNHDIAFELGDGYGECWSAATGGAFAMCNQVDLGIEILILQEDVPDLEVLTGIEPTKLVLYYPFDFTLDEGIVDALPAGEERGMMINAGTFGHEADAVWKNFRHLAEFQTGAPIIGPNSLALQTEGSLSSVQFGREDNKAQFNFLTSEVTDIPGRQYSINFWYIIVSNATNFASGSNSYILSSANAVESNSIILYLNSSLNLGLNIISDSDGIFSENNNNALVSKKIPNDLDWHMITVMVDKTNSTFGEGEATLCIDNSCETLVAFAEYSSSCADQPTCQDGALILGEPSDNQGADISNIPIEANYDDLCIWKDHVLTASQRATLFNAGAGTACGAVTAVALISATCNGLTATIVGTAGDDFLEGTSGDDVIAGLEGNDFIQGKGGNDTICGNEGDDYITAGSGEDFVRGDAGKDYIRGGAGNDDIRGNGGADRLHGGSGDDLINGGGGDDILVGGSENDSLNGGNGVDICDDSAPTDTVSNCELTT